MLQLVLRPPLVVAMRGRIGRVLPGSVRHASGLLLFIAFQSPLDYNNTVLNSSSYLYYCISVKVFWHVNVVFYIYSICIVNAYVALFSISTTLIGGIHYWVNGCLKYVHLKFLNCCFQQVFRPWNKGARIVFWHPCFILLVAVELVTIREGPDSFQGRQQQVFKITH